MYYKVIKNGKVIDVLDHLTFVKHQQKHDVMLGMVPKMKLKLLFLLTEIIFGTLQHYIKHLPVTKQSR